MSKRITSASNKEIKYLNKLLIKSSFRKKEEICRRRKEGKL